MTKLTRLVLFILTVSIVASCNKRSGKARVLVFSKTTGFRHTSIEPAKQALIKLGQENNFTVDTTEDSKYFTEDSLKNYSAVVFLHTTLDVLNGSQEADFERYIQAGGGFVGVHSATDTEYDWGWYGRLVGAYFESHPEQQDATLHVIDQANNSTKHLPKEWKRKDEWYNFKNISKDIKVLIKIDEKTYKGGKNNEDHPMSWYHDFDGGRAFYTALGHTDESWKEENFLKHLLGGIQYAIGDNKNLDYAKARSQRTPEEDRFTKTVLTEGTLFEPTEMTILPNFDVLIAQRRGEIMLFKNQDKSIKQAALLDVYWKTDIPGVNAEEGVMGLQADPDFAKNHFIYVYYSPKDTSVNRLSRFKFENDTIDVKSEKIILQLYSQRNICCHTGGSIAFGTGRTMYLSTGDNSTPFDEPKQPYVNRGYGPMDDRPGHEQYDARRSSSNSNDLRGKILRIIVNEDGTYSVPEGNLFAKGQEKTRPEIYVMGNRNPYRISVDKKTGFLYWGEVGPDAGSDSMETRGPKGYDELNQARNAGYFGWPLFVGNNYPYRQYDYATGKSGPAYDPAKPVNNSRNNTGITNLPPVQPAFIWYPYDNSKEFPQLGSGSRNAMAGPTYYVDAYPKETRMPDYYDKKLFIYDWMRNWIKVVTMKPNGDFDKMESFMAGTRFYNMIDMEVGPDGKIYVLEYGTGWFSKNADAGLSRIDYNGGNRAPKVANLTVDKTSGRLPFTVTVKVDAKDPENDALTYTWHFGDVTKETKEGSVQHTFEKPGDYAISVDVTDGKSPVTKSEVENVYAGNEAPSVSIAVKGNQSFFFPGKPVQYEVKINDPDDTSSVKDMNNLLVTADYAEGRGRRAAMGHQVLTDAMIGKNIMNSLDCKTCHKVNEKSIGPSYTDIAKRYEKDPNAVNYLSEKIIKGGGGVWGEVAMAAHPTLKESDAKQIVAWIQTLAGEAQQKKSLPPVGSVAPSSKPATANTALFITATYTDKGRANIKPLTGTTTLVLRNSRMGFAGVKEMDKFQTYDVNGSKFMITPTTNGWFAIDSIDLSGVTSVVISAGWQQAPEFGYTIELRLDSPQGQLLGTFDLKGVKPKGSGANEQSPPSFTTLKSSFVPVSDGKLHKLYVVTKSKDPKENQAVGLQWIEFR